MHFLLKQTFLLSDWLINLGKFAVRQHGERKLFFTFLFRPWIVQRYKEETEILASSIVTVHCIGDRHTQLRGAIMSFNQTRPAVIECQLLNLKGKGFTSIATKYR